LNRCMISSNPCLISSKASRIPIHWRGPVPNGRYEYGSRLLFTSGEKLSGLNSKGLSQTSGSRCNTYVGMLTSIPLGNRMPLYVLSSAHSRTRRNAGPLRRRTSQMTWSRYSAFCTTSYRGLSLHVSTNSSISRMRRSWTSGLVAR